MEADPPLDIRDVHGRPEVIRECAPDRVVVVERDRVLDAEGTRLRDDVVEVPLEAEFGRVDAHDRQAGVRVFRGPGPNIGEGAEPVDAGVGPEVDEDDPSAKPIRRQRLGVEPAGRAIERAPGDPRSAGPAARRSGDGRWIGSGRVCRPGWTPPWRRRCRPRCRCRRTSRCRPKRPMGHLDAVRANGLRVDRGRTRGGCNVRHVAPPLASPVGMSGRWASPSVGRRGPRVE